MKFEFKQQLDKPDTLDLYIYDEVAPNGYDYWNGTKIISETSADYFRTKLAEYKDIKFINLYINSVGGSVREGYGIYAQLARHEAYKTGHDDGFANSIASVIFQACDKRIMRINSVQGIHNMMDVCYGNATEHRQCATNLDAMMEGNRQLYMAKAGGKITLEKLTELMDAETILTAQQCLEYGLCDEIAEMQVEDPQEMTQKMQRINANMAAQIQHFRQLKQYFGDAMTAVSIPNKKAEPENEPQQNKTASFFSKLSSKK
jgi:ATP-dependent protease ClpP protease subunit